MNIHPLPNLVMAAGEKVAVDIEGRLNCQPSRQRRRPESSGRTRGHLHLCRSPASFSLDSPEEAPALASQECASNAPVRPPAKRFPAVLCGFDSACSSGIRSVMRLAPLSPPCSNPRSAPPPRRGVFCFPINCRWRRSAGSPSASSSCRPTPSRLRRRRPPPGRGGGSGPVPAGNGPYTACRRRARRSRKR